MTTIKELKYGLLNSLGMRLRRIVFTETDLGHLPPYQEAQADINIRRIEPEEVDSLVSLMSEHQLPVLKERIGKGDLCWAAFHRGKPVGMRWLSLKEGYDEANDIRIVLGPGEAYAYHKLVHPDYRNLGIGTALNHATHRWLAEQGATRLLALVDYRNYASRRSMEKSGQKPAKIMYILRIAGRRVFITRGLKNRNLSRL